NVPVNVVMLYASRRDSVHCHPFVGLIVFGPGSANEPSGVGSFSVRSSAGSGAALVTVIVSTAVSPTATGSGVMPICIVKLGRCGSVTAGAVRCAAGASVNIAAAAEAALGVLGDHGTVAALGSQLVKIASSNNMAARRNERWCNIITPGC